VIAARCSQAVRVDASDHATSAVLRPGRSARRSRSADACARKAAWVRPDSSHGSGTSGSARSTGADVSIGGSSRIAWALVPLMPNDDTPARRGRPLRAQGRGEVSSSTAPADQSTCGDGASAFSVRGNRSCCIASTILMTPAAPAAAWE